MLRMVRASNFYFTPIAPPNLLSSVIFCYLLLPTLADYFGSCQPCQPSLWRREGSCEGSQAGSSTGHTATLGGCRKENTFSRFVLVLVLRHVYSINNNVNIK